MEIYKKDYGSAILSRSLNTLEDVRYYTFSTGTILQTGTINPLGSYNIKIGGGPTQGSTASRDGLREITPSSLAPLSKDAWHVVEVIVVGSVLRMKADGREVAAFEDTLSRLKQGQIAVRLANGRGIRIRSIKIQELGRNRKKTSGGTGSLPTSVSKPPMPPDATEKTNALRKSRDKGGGATAATHDALQQGTAWSGFRQMGAADDPWSLKVLDRAGNRITAEIIAGREGDRIYRFEGTIDRRNGIPSRQNKKRTFSRDSRVRYEARRASA
jgi:hypothetical protein